MKGEVLSGMKSCPLRPAKWSFDIKGNLPHSRWKSTSFHKRMQWGDGVPFLLLVQHWLLSLRVPS